MSLNDVMPAVNKGLHIKTYHGHRYSRYMNNLMPQQRMDRNGKIVTRHVKSDSSKSASPTLPNVYPSESSQAITRVIERKLNESIRDSDALRKAGFWNRKKLMKTLGADTTRTIAECGGQKHGRHEAAIPHDLLSHCVAKGSFAPLNDLAAYLKDHGTLSSKSTWEPAQYLAGLYQSDTEKPDGSSLYGFSPYSQASAEERLIQHKVIRAAEFLKAPYVVLAHWNNEASTFPSWRFKNPELVRYMKDHPENIDELVRVMTTRMIVPETQEDLAGVIELMNTKDETAAPLEDGVL